MVEGAPHTAKKQLLCFGVPPAPVNKGGEGRRPALGGAPSGGKPTRTPSPSRPLPSFGGGKGKEREREKERGAAPPPLVQLGLGRGEARATSWLFSPLSTKAQ